MKHSPKEIPHSKRWGCPTADQRVLTMGYLLISLGILIGLSTRLLAVFQYVTFDIGPDPDQIRDAFAVMNMWRGDLPTLGPQVSTVGRHHILPLYYYLFFPFTLLGPNPIFQALPNALFSFLSIPLFIYLIYQLLERIEKSKRIFLSGLGGFWYSLLYGDIFISNFQWNPSSIPFFIMVLTLLFKLQMQGNFSFAIQALLWTVYGAILAIIVSLHSSTLFVMPVVFAVTSSIFIYDAIKRKRKFLLVSFPFVSILSALITLTPYWIGEIGRNFNNTKAILRTIFETSRQSDENILISIYTKISNLFLSYIMIAQQAYFWNTSWLYLIISITFLSLVTGWGLFKFKGNRHIWLMWCSLWAVFLLAASNINPIETPFYYKLLLLFAPIVFTLSSLAYLDCSPTKKKIFSCLIGLFIFLSVASNLFYDYRFMVSKYGPERLVNTADIIQIMNQLPARSTICDPRIERKREVNNQYNYIDTYITHKRISLLSECQPGNFVIHPKRNMLIKNNVLNENNYEGAYFVRLISPPTVNLFPVFKVAENGPIVRRAELFSEVDTADVYRLEE
ncbi:MAG: hypothetical protein AAF921_01725 [Cyanobacteria bacterium P01_D01_bin.44]